MTNNVIDQINFPIDEALNGPIVSIGGVGGSGTRLLAAIMQSAGISMGGDLNVSLDNLWYTLLFKQIGIDQISDAEFQQRLRYFIGANIGGVSFDQEQTDFIESLASPARPLHDCEWLRERAKTLLAATNLAGSAQPWGWKEPNTHICLDRLMKNFPTMKYIHVARSGIDMAFSANQAQLEFWGEKLTGRTLRETPHDSLHYWCISHARVFKIAKKFEDRFLFLKFEDLCHNPEKYLEKVLRFLALNPSEEQIRKLANHVQPPSSIDRYKLHDMNQFAADDIDYVRSLGFAVES